MRAAGYMRFELLRTFRNRRFLLFSLAFPLGLYFVIAVPSRDEQSLGGSGIPAPVYFMVSLAAFGTMNAVLSAGARIAVERAVGWNRQLRITPLSTRAYLRAKVVTAYATALVTIALLYAAGGSLGVSLTAGSWLRMTALLLVGLVPFAALGILIGHLVSADSVGPAMGGVTAVLALLGGVWFPIGGGVLHVVSQALPSYWLVQASRVATGGSGWGGEGWLVVTAWTVVLSAGARRAFERDTKRA